MVFQSNPELGIVEITDKNHICSELKAVTMKMPLIDNNFIDQFEKFLTQSNDQSDVSSIEAMIDEQLNSSEQNQSYNWAMQKGSITPSHLELSQQQNELPTDFDLKLSNSISSIKIDSVTSSMPVELTSSKEMNVIDSDFIDHIETILSDEIKLNGCPIPNESMLSNDAQAIELNSSQTEQNIKNKSKNTLVIIKKEIEQNDEHENKIEQQKRKKANDMTMDCNTPKQRKTILRLALREVPVTQGKTFDLKIPFPKHRLQS